MCFDAWTAFCSNHGLYVELQSLSHRSLLSENSCQVPIRALKTTLLPTHFMDTSQFTTVTTQKFYNLPIIQFLNGIKRHVDASK